MKTARRTILLAAVALGLTALSGCAKGSTSVDEDLTKANGGPLGPEDLCGPPTGVAVLDALGPHNMEWQSDSVARPN